MSGSRLKPLTVKEIEKLTAAPPSCIKHRYLGGVPGFTLVHTPAGYTGYGLISRHFEHRKQGLRRYGEAEILLKSQPQICTIDADRR